ncbi:MAG TPA: hypothetical protein VMV15_01885 [Candidatus Binataceae bacterium]|nr:hypothetical protein [Candidatus Binataceae bacterium]
MLAVLAAALVPLRAFAQLTAGITAQQLFVDPITGQVFIRPGHGRVPLKFEGASSAAIEQQVQQQVDQKVQASEARLQESNAQLQASNADLEKKVSAMQPAWRTFADNFGSKIKIGTLVYGDYAFFAHTGYGPQNLTQFNPPGPGNNSWNSFDITRTYLNFLFSPTKDWTLRVTPNMYRTIGSANQKYGTNQALGSDLNGNVGVRIKYAYLRYNSAFKWWDPIKTDTITVGQQSNPLVDWEEQMYGFRYVNLTPWNYLSLSSSQTGLSVQGPIIFNEKQYVDYDFGVFDNASFHSAESTNTKEGMERISLFPFGAKWRFDGLGFTEFFNYGYGNTTPDAAQLPASSKGGNAAIYRLAALVHYETEQSGIAFEYDLGKNAFSSGNLFSGSGPPQEFGFSGPPQYTAWTSMVNGILNRGNTRQEGFDAFGHYHFPYTPFTLFGMSEWFMPDTKIKKNPLDFNRYIVGVNYQYNEFLRFALDVQNLSYYHSQFTLPAQDGIAATPFAVPRDSNSIWLNVEFNY